MKWIVIALIAVVVISFSSFLSQNSRCNSAGGVLVKIHGGYICVKRDSIIEVKP